MVDLLRKRPQLTLDTLTDKFLYVFILLHDLLRIHIRVCMLRRVIAGNRIRLLMHGTIHPVILFDHLLNEFLIHLLFLTAVHKRHLCPALLVDLLFLRIHRCFLIPAIHDLFRLLMQLLGLRMYQLRLLP